MSAADSPTPEGEPDPEGGVLGNLPRSRPSVRSPNRPAPPPESRSGHRPGAAGADSAGEDGSGDLEALVRTGASAAGGVAGLGLRIAGRAAAALRDAVERR